ncbi:beta-xylosidase [Streptomyces sp. GbtcB7]|uniref:GH39 family glycosyl hydrolase n=1 Tax=Streptomyces sp. GbtcB7 TaxID=2824752 RepID=UPI001C305022|nr:beta-xylosidase [Streptomyces sp. GbtcB7]
MTISLHADAHATGTELTHFWSACVGAGRAAEGLRAGWQEHLRLVRDAAGFRYVRFHGLFHDDMFVYRKGADGQPILNFQYVDDVFDRMLQAGVRPFVELGFSPGDLAREKATTFWWGAHGSPPTDLGQWAELITAIAEHWVHRYGLDEVRSWYFEVWNEPNLNPFFRGARSEYFDLYAVSVTALKAIDAQLRVGGPATSNFVPDGRFAGEHEDTSQHAVVAEAKDLDSLDWQPVWVADFLEFCHSRSLPVDFVSCHPYPTDWALDGHGNTQQHTRASDATTRDLRTLRALVDASPYPDAEIHLTEWNSSPSPRDHTHDHLQAATFVVKANLESIGLTESLCYWAFTDVFEEGGAGDTVFHGGFGMITYQGVPKPSFHAYRMLNQLGDELLIQTEGAAVTRHRASGSLSALAYHYPAEVTQAPPGSFDGRSVAQDVLATGSPRRLRIELTGLSPRSSVTIETLDAEQGNAIAAWHAMGAPEPPTREQTVLLRKAGHAVGQRVQLADDEGRFLFDEEIPSWSVVLIRQDRDTQ